MRWMYIVQLRCIDQKDQGMEQAEEERLLSTGWTTFLPEPLVCSVITADDSTHLGCTALPHAFTLGLDSSDTLPLSGCPDAKSQFMYILLQMILIVYLRIGPIQETAQLILPLADRE